MNATSELTPEQQTTIKRMAARFGKKLATAKSGPIENEDAESKRTLLQKLNEDPAALEQFIERGAKKAQL